MLSFVSLSPPDWEAANSYSRGSLGPVTACEASLLVFLLRLGFAGPFMGFCLHVELKRAYQEALAGANDLGSLHSVHLIELTCEGWRPAAHTTHAFTKISLLPRY